MRTGLFLIALSWALTLGAGYEVAAHIGDAVAVFAPITNALAGGGQ